MNVLPVLFGLSLLALASALLQLVQTRMMTTPTDDPQTRSQQRIFLILPLFSLIYGWFLPAGLFIYWITTTIFSIVQQYLINRLGRPVPAVRLDARVRQEPPAAIPSPVVHTARRDTEHRRCDCRRHVRRIDPPLDDRSAAGTIRPAEGRTSRRGRRR